MVEPFPLVPATWMAGPDISPRPARWSNFLQRDGPSARRSALRGVCFSQLVKPPSQVSRSWKSDGGGGIGVKEDNRFLLAVDVGPVLADHLDQARDDETTDWPELRHR